MAKVILPDTGCESPDMYTWWLWGDVRSVTQHLRAGHGDTNTSLQHAVSLAPLGM
ncbi:hypothetical protein [Streptacidiphilus sp. PAMC 29251]